MKIECSACGEILHNGEFKPIDEVLARTDFKCPKCGQPLSSKNPKVTVRKGKGT